MNYRHILHGEFKSSVENNTAPFFVTLLDSFMYYLQIAYDYFSGLVDYFIIGTSESTYVDRHAKDYLLERITGEADANLINRIKDVFNGKVATKEHIENAVNRILAAKEYTETCTAYEWWNKDWLDKLDLGFFTIQLPNVTRWGFVVGYSGFSYIGETRSFREGFFSSIASMLENLDLDLIRKTLNSKKGCGIQYRLSLDGNILEDYSF